MILTIGALVRCFASIFMTASMNKTNKRIAVLVSAVVLYAGYVLTSNTAINNAVIFSILIDGLVSGFTALGIYESTKPTDNG